MRTLLAPALLFFSMLVPAAAATKDVFAPENLPGKTLEFNIQGGNAPLATVGKWTGTFEKNPADRFTIRNVNGNTISGSGVWAYVGSAFPLSHSYTITPFLPPNKPATLTIWTEKSGSRFYIEADKVTQYGVVSIKIPTVPEIVIQQPAGSNLTDGKTNKSFGTIKIGNTGKPKVFKIKNTGTAKLTGLAIKKTGAHSGNFIVAQPKKSSLAPGDSTTFEVSFKPSAKGTRKAAIQIASNDADENPFDIQLTGEGSVK